MNLVDCYVTEVISKPYRKFGHWWLDVEYSCWGATSKTQMMFKTEEGAAAVVVGHRFLS